MERNIIELSQTYQLGVSDEGFVVYQLYQDGDKGKKNKGTFCKTIFGVIDFLANCELQNELVDNLERMAETLEAIRKEIADAICKSQAEFN